MRAGTTTWATSCSRAPGRPAPPMCEVSGAGLPSVALSPKPSFGGYSLKVIRTMDTDRLVSRPREGRAA